MPSHVCSKPILFCKKIKYFFFSSLDYNSLSCEQWGISTYMSQFSLQHTVDRTDHISISSWVIFIYLLYLKNTYNTRVWGYRVIKPFNFSNLSNLSNLSNHLYYNHVFLWRFVTNMSHLSPGCEIWTINWHESVE